MRKILSLITLSLVVNYIICAQSSPFKQEDPSSMVDLYTGDFTYSIPLMSIPSPSGSYPISLNYRSGITLEQEASWVGLGWDVSAGGAIQRQVIQYPDDASGELMAMEIHHESDENLSNVSTYNVRPDGSAYYSNLSVREPKLNSMYGTLYMQDIPYEAINSFTTSLNANVNSVERFPGYVDIPITNTMLQAQLNGNIVTIYDEIDYVTDIVQANKEGQLYNNLNPIYQGKDVYMLTGPLTGQIEPIRFDNPSASMATPFKNHYDFYNSGSQIKYIKYKCTDYQQDKVQFRMKGELSNSYNYHLGIDNSLNVNVFDYYQIEPKWCDDTDEDVLVRILRPSENQPEHINQVEETRTGFNAELKELSQSNYVRWFSNDEFNDNTAKYAGFINHKSSFLKPNWAPEKGIGGFMVTDASGTTYHYSIAVYNKNKELVTTFDGITSKVLMTEPVAEKWLLTAITGPDYVDNGTVGVIDEEDFGYWIKFDYGKLHSDFPWRYPYEGEAYSHKDVDVKYYEEGEREVYYLNYIQTPSHIALFNKIERSDLRSVEKNGECLKKLRLKEIILLTNESYNKLDISLGFNMGTVLTNSDFTNSHHNFINNNQISRVKFGQDYSLCDNTPSSFSTSFDTSPSTDNYIMGKLTLDGIQFRGENNQVIAPDFKFMYSVNPTYHKEKWDAWGAYKNTNGQPSIYNRKSNEDGNAWNLDKIITPTGTEIVVEYARDDYSSINGYTLKDVNTYSDPNNLNDIDFYSAGNTLWAVNHDNLQEYVSIGEQIELRGKVIGVNCPSGGSDENLFMTTVKVTNVDGNEIEFTPSLSDLFDLYSSNWCENQYVDDLSVFFESQYTPSNRKGGNVRVEKIKIIEPNSSDELSYDYIYTKDGSDNGESSGVASDEPSIIRVRDFDYDNIELPQNRSVGYSNVRVRQMSNYFESSYTDYSFYTPHFNMVKLKTLERSGPVIYSEFYYREHKCNPSTTPYKRGGKAYRNKVYQTIISDDLIGGLKERSLYNSNDNLINKQEYIYDYPENNLGEITQACNLFDDLDRVYNYAFSGNATDDDLAWSRNKRGFNRIINSITTYKPHVLKSIKTTTGLGTDQVNNIEFDYLTGQVIKQEKIKGDQKHLVETQFAHKQEAYSPMGSKFIDPNNKNMLAQQVGAKLSKIENNGSLNVISASAKTWDNATPIRYFDQGADMYFTENYDQNVWRPSGTCVWKSFLDDDGTIENFEGFDWNAEEQNDSWKKASEIKLYNQYSKPIEKVDINGSYASTKMNYDGSKAILSAVNAEQSEVYFSSAERAAGTDDHVNHFEGEVIGAEYIYEDQAYAHTGKRFVRQFEVTDGFKIQGDVGENGQKFKRRNYRASVWVHENQASCAELRYVLKNVDDQVINEAYTNINDESTLKAGDWYLLELDVSLISEQITYMEVFTNKNTSGSQYWFCAFDDFKFQPLKSVVTGYVYDDIGRLVAELDNDNIAKKFTYDAAGRIIKVEQEIADKPNMIGGFKVVEETEYNYGRE